MVSRVSILGKSDSLKIFGKRGSYQYCDKKVVILWFNVVRRRCLFVYL